METKTTTIDAEYSNEDMKAIASEEYERGYLKGYHDALEYAAKQLEAARPTDKAEPQTEDIY